MKYIVVILSLFTVALQQRIDTRRRARAHVGRHRMAAVAPGAVPYLVRPVEGATSHRRRQGGLVMPTRPEQMAA